MNKLSAGWKVYVAYCLNVEHEEKGDGAFFLITKGNPLEILQKLGCPICKEIVEFKANPLPEEDFFAWVQDEQLTRGFTDEDDHYGEMKLDEMREELENEEETPEDKTSQSKPIDIAGLEAYLTKWIVGQPVAIRKVMRAIRPAETGWRTYPHQPKGIFLIAGPTGSGKTELVRRLAMFFNGVTDPFLSDDRILIKLDMSEYMEHHDNKKITGAAHSYVGFGSQTALARVEEFETAFVVLDEVDKAHPSVLDVFLQIFDDGVLTVMVRKPNARNENEYEEKKIRFGHCYFFLTSNYGSKDVHRLLRGQKLGFQPAHGRELDPQGEIGKATLRAMDEHLRAEFLGRIHEVIVFYPLDGDETKKRILSLRTNEELQPMLKRKQITLELSQEAEAFLIEQGFDRTRGARSLKDSVRKYVTDGLAQGELDGKIKPGDHVILKGPLKRNGGDEDDGYILDFEVVRKPALPEGSGEPEKPPKA